ncbi:MAG: hypothetical protein JWQ81_8695 [Amycolatopsis sp.]|jgi:ferredoxin|uniref:ferredoxin n=1 Tax=Amycolatopsis sp. TaxID=37632 RepID=UPI0026195F7B|nr:ferredoxin [Amycolatopsis sp.]MCU1687956.1 hypothetical protein [Amycolatopsis sp.]
MVRISIDTDRCIGAGQCVLSSPEVFDQDEHGFVVVIADHPAGPLAESARLAGRICPSQTITVHEG